MAPCKTCIHKLRQLNDTLCKACDYYNDYAMYEKAGMGKSVDEQRVRPEGAKASTYKVVGHCGECRIADECCIRTGILEINIFKSLGNGKLYAFVHDRGECGGLEEVAPERPNDKLMPLGAFALRWKGS